MCGCRRLEGPPAGGMWVAAVALATVAPWVTALDNGVAHTPPLGWNSWNHFHGRVSSDVLKATADRFISLGLADAGYTFVNTDDGWSVNPRDNRTGRIVPGPNFGGNESSMRSLAAYIKSKGLKFGIYGAAGETTCLRRAGGLYHEHLDAQTYAEWGVSYLKYDDCGEVDIQSYAKFSAMRDALNATGVPIVYSYEPHLQVAIGWPQYVGNAWRTGGDIGASYDRLLHELVVINAWASVTGPGSWGDADILEVGNDGLSLAEQRTHFALWAMVKSPLLLGCDLTNVSEASLAIMKNRALIAINQDALGVQAIKVNATAGKTTLLLPPAVQARLDAMAEAHLARHSRAPHVGGALTWCDWDPENIAETQQVVLQRASAGVTIEQAGQCLTVVEQSFGLVQFTPCQPNLPAQLWVATGVNETVAQISPHGGTDQCLGTDGEVLALEPCATEPAECKLQRCATSALRTQLWYHSARTHQLISSFTNVSIPPLDKSAALWAAQVAPCNSTDPAQKWSMLSNGSVLSTATEGCLSDAQKDLTVAPCVPGDTTQKWALQGPYGSLVGSNGCADVFNFSGPAVQTSDHCKKHKPGHRGSQNEEWQFDKSSGQLRSAVTPECCSTPERPIPAAGECLAVTRTPAPPPPPAPPPTGLINIPLCIATAASPVPEPPKPPPLVDSSLSLQVWAGPLAGGDVAVALLNADDDGAASITVRWGDIGVPAGTAMKATDLYAGSVVGTFTDGLTMAVGAHDVAALRLSRA